MSPGVYMVFHLYQQVSDYLATCSELWLSKLIFLPVLWSQDSPNFLVLMPKRQMTKQFHHSHIIDAVIAVIARFWPL